jgi:hypothetical protein
MPFATPHINVRRVWHIFVKVTWPFVSPDATVVPVNMTIHMKCCIACKRQSPEKEKSLSSSISFVIFFHIVWGRENFVSCWTHYSRSHLSFHKPYYVWKLGPLLTKTHYFVVRHRSERFWNVLGILLPFLYCDGINAVCLKWEGLCILLCLKF